MQHNSKKIDVADTDFHTSKLRDGSETDPNLNVKRIMQALEDNGE